MGERRKPPITYHDVSRLIRIEGILGGITSVQAGNFIRNAQEYLEQAGALREKGMLEPNGVAKPPPDKTL